MNNGFPLQRTQSPHKLKEALHDIVKKEVEETFGHTIASSRDCIRLSEEIYAKTSFRINANTLRRFFGLVKAQYPPSLSTLTILANYCGYQSLEELSVVKEKMERGQNAIDEKSMLHYLVTLFSGIPPSKASDEAFFILIKHTVKFISLSPELANKFQRAIIKNKNGQELYFEQYIQIDKLNSFYGEGLRYYLNEKKSVEGQVFGYSLLCVRDWLSGDQFSLRKNFEQVKKQILPKKANPFLSGYYFAAYLLYADENQLDTHKVLADAYKTQLALKPVSKSLHLFQSFEYIMASVLVWTRYYQDTIFYINEAYLAYTKPTSSIDQTYYSRLVLFKAVAYAKSGITDEAERLFEQIHPSQLSFLSKKTDTILYLLLARSLKKTNKKLEKQLEELVRETGFLKLKMLVESTVNQVKN
jgi:hypothetical protein